MIRLNRDWRQQVEEWNREQDSRRDARDPFAEGRRTAETLVALMGAIMLVAGVLWLVAVVL